MWEAAMRAISSFASFGEHFLGCSDGLRRIEPFGTGLCAIHNRVAAIQLE